MSAVHCGVCDRELHQCECEVIAANVWDAAKSAWMAVRATIEPSPHQKCRPRECGMPRGIIGRGEDSCA